MAISPRSSPHHDSQVSGRPCTPTRQGSTSTTHNQHHGHSTPSRQTADCLDPLAGIANSPRKGPKEQSDQHSPKANRTPKGKEGTFPSLSIPVEATFFHNNGNKSRTRTNSGRTNQQHTETLPQSESHVDEQALFQFIQELGLDRNASSVSTDTGSSTDQHIENLQPTSLPVGGSGVSYPPANGYQELRPELTYSALSQGQSQSPVDRLQSATQINQASSCVPADLSQLPVRHQQPDNRSNGQVNQSHIRPSAENDVWWWHTVQPGQQHFVDNIASQPNEHDRTPFVDHEHNVYNDYSAFPSGAYNSAPFGFTFHNDDEEQAALQCFQILERLTPQQAVRVLNCVAHLFESEVSGFGGAVAPASLPPPLPLHHSQFSHTQHNQYAPHDEAPQQSRQSSRTIYATMPAPAHQSVSQDARAVVHHGAGDTDAAHGRDPRSRRAPSPQRSSHAQGTRTPPRGTEYSALGSSSDAVGRSSATAAFSTPRVTLFRPPPPITTPINGTGDGKRPADRRALSECPTDSHLTDSRSATPASASTAATSVVTRAKSTSEDPDTSSSFDGLKTVSPTHQWCGVLTETEVCMRCVLSRTKSL